MNEEPTHDNVPAEPSVDGATPDGDSLLTAYALGELSDVERCEIEERLRGSPDDQRAVDEISRLGKLFRATLSASPVTTRSPDLNEAVTAELAKPPQLDAPLQLPERFPRRRFWLPLSLAAALLVTCGTLFGLMRTKRFEHDVARHDGIQVSPGLSDSEITDLAVIPEIEQGVDYQDESTTDLGLQSKLGRSQLEDGETLGVMRERIVAADASRPETEFGGGRRSAEANRFYLYSEQDGAVDGNQPGGPGATPLSAVPAESRSKNGAAPSRGFSQPDSFGMGMGGQVPGGVDSSAMMRGMAGDTAESRRAGAMMGGPGMGGGMMGGGMSGEMSRRPFQTMLPASIVQAKNRRPKC